MENKIVKYIGVGAIVLLFFGTFAMGIMNRMVTKNNVVIDTKSDKTYNEMMDSMHPNELINNSIPIFTNVALNLSKYRSKDIPKICRLEEGNNDTNVWIEHLGHDENTKFCLDYYK